MTDREKLIELICNAIYGVAEYWAGVIADHLIANGVTVQKHGRWEHIDDGLFDSWKCSVCGEEWSCLYDPTDTETLINYCPECGAKMQEETNAPEE